MNIPVIDVEKAIVENQLGLTWGIWMTATCACALTHLALVSGLSKAEIIADDLRYQRARSITSYVKTRYGLDDGFIAGFLNGYDGIPYDMCADNGSSSWDLGFVNGKTIRAELDQKGLVVYG